MTLLLIDQGSIASTSDQTGLSSLSITITTANTFEYGFVDLAWSTLGNTVTLAGVSDSLGNVWFTRYVYTAVLNLGYITTVARCYFAIGNPQSQVVTATLSGSPTNGFSMIGYAVQGINYVQPYDPAGMLPMQAVNAGTSFTQPTVSNITTANANDIILWQCVTKSSQSNNIPAGFTNLATNEMFRVAFTAESDYMNVQFVQQGITLQTPPVSSWIAVADAVTDPPLYQAYVLGIGVSM